MSVLFLMLGVTFLLGELCDLFCRPRPARLLRGLAGLPARWLPVLALSGLLLMLTGAPLLALLLTAVVLLVLVLGSNLKNRLLSEPFVFTDLAVIPAFFRYPRFYLQAIPLPTRLLLVPGLAGLILLVIWQSSPALAPRLIGAALMGASLAVLHFTLPSMARRLAPRPELHATVGQFGLLPALLLYSWHWRHETLPPPAGALPASLAPEAPEIVLVVQCESFADPADIVPAREGFAELARAQGQALQWGQLEVSGFGAYTMRSEYGVLVGRSEEELGFRRYDPFLTATRDRACALPRRLRHLYGRRLFLHPHNLHFYNRIGLMPELGFTEMVSETAFTPADRNGPYVSDQALGRRLAEEINRDGPVFCYTVTMENHGPWAAGRAGQASGRAAWHHHAHNGARLLETLTQALAASGREALLVFFGDHRPALAPLDPRAPQPARHTPYVMLRFSKGQTVTTPHSAHPVTLTPAGLYQAILREIEGR
ncbi:LTA synthase family protein [Oecophyllibacter saccharovorans]|uniref:LTA synthase family protein n=1 Tax=Oecophyllibacter saccharovorans TaxID=2558360 RepID=UPI001144CE96|nr:LTA synthase family protein [Oecophyllibacter saccharovorans]QDH15513.1 LTA synthase family protein [Oecophyllibacter saccharovorans]